MTSPVDAEICRQGWEALRADPLPWLLNTDNPAAASQTLMHVVGRPAQSQAVARARGGANAAVPISGLLSDLQPDGRWEGPSGYWELVEGGGWRTVAAVQLGADPADPRLQATAEVLAGDLSSHSERSPADVGVLQVVAIGRGVCALSQLGWRGDPRFVELMAWLEAWVTESQAGETQALVSACILQGLCASDQIGGRAMLENRCAEILCEYLGSVGRTETGLSMPNLKTTDAGEALWSLAIAGRELEPRVVPVLRSLQERQDEQGRWRQETESGELATIGGHPGLTPGGANPWLTARMVRVMQAFAVKYCLPRAFPQKPV